MSGLFGNKSLASSFLYIVVSRLVGLTRQLFRVLEVLVAVAVGSHQSSGFGITCNQRSVIGQLSTQATTNIPMYYSDQEKNAIISLPVLPFIVCQASAGVTIVPASGGHIPAQAVLAAGLAASSQEN